MLGRSGDDGEKDAQRIRGWDLDGEAEGREKKKRKRMKRRKKKKMMRRMQADVLWMGDREAFGRLAFVF